MPLIRKISVKFDVIGMHYWKAAPTKRAYLRDNHRHKFFVIASIDVEHNDRDIEFHDFLDFCKKDFPSGQLGGQSCETLAEYLIERIQKKYPNRGIVVQVWEDNEVGAILTLDID